MSSSDLGAGARIKERAEKQHGAESHENKIEHGFRPNDAFMGHKVGATAVKPRDGFARPGIKAA